MNIKLARKLDLYLGIPLCWGFSLFDRVFRKPWEKKCHDQNSPKKIIFLLLSEMGSIILSCPAVEKVKKLYPKAEIYYWTFNENAEIIYNLKLMPEKNIIKARSNNIFISILDLIKNILKIRKIGIDTVIDMELFTRASSILSYATGAPERIGFYRFWDEGLYRGQLYTHKVKYNPYQHIKNNFIFLADRLNDYKNGSFSEKQTLDQDKTKLPVLNSSAQDKQAMWSKLRRINPLLKREWDFILINFGAFDKIELRKWPKEYYKELIGKILKHENLCVIFVGMGQPDKKDIIKHERSINLIGKTNIKELISLCNISKALISHDNGIVHIASLTKIFICALFGPETPLLYAPLSENKKIFYKEYPCSPCLSVYNQRSFECDNIKCMRSITVDEVYNSVSENVC